MKKLLLLVICVLTFLTTSAPQAKIFKMQLYALTGSSGGNFFDNYSHLTQCIVDIEDSAIVPNAFVSIESAQLKEISCSVPGVADTYTFSYGTEAIKDILLQSVTNRSGDFGLRFDSDRKPWRFDTRLKDGPPWGYGFFDEPDEETKMSVADDESLLQFEVVVIEEYRTKMAAVLLEPATVGSTPREAGYIASYSLNVESGKEIALLNGTFRFSEQHYKDGENGLRSNEFIQERLVLQGFYTFDEKLSLPFMKITQAVFQDNNNPIQLVHERTTAIIVEKGIFSTTRTFEFTITDITCNNSQDPDCDSEGEIFKIGELSFDPGEKPNQLIFFCDDRMNYCNLKEGRLYEFKLTLDQGFISEQLQVAKVERSSMLELFFVPIISLGIDSWAEATLRDRSFMETHTARYNKFIQQVYPLADDGLTLVDDIFSEHNPRSLKDPITGSSNNCNRNWNPFSKSDIALCDTLKIEKIKRKHKALGDFLFKRGVGIVHDQYFDDLGNGKIVGIRKRIGNKSPKSVLVELSAGIGTVAHEIGHTFGLPIGKVNNIGRHEEYDIDPNTGEPFCAPSKLVAAQGFDVYNKKYKIDKINFMGCGLKNDDSWWVDNETWKNLQIEFKKTKDDPFVLYIAFMITDNDSVFPMNWHAYEGFDDDLGEGTHSVVTLDASNNIIHNYKFTPDFEWEVEGGENLLEDKTAIVLDILFGEEVRRIEIRGESNEILFSIDPEVKLIQDYAKEILFQCNLESSMIESINLLAQRVLSAISQNTFNQLSLNDFDSLINQYASIDNQNCDFASSYFNDIDDVVESMLKQRQRLDIIFDNTDNVIVGDLDHDGDVDRDDLDILMAHRNQPASGADDPMDLDGDGQITGLDARILTQLCTRPRCAVE